LAVAGAYALLIATSPQHHPSCNNCNPNRQAGAGHQRGHPRGHCRLGRGPGGAGAASQPGGPCAAPHRPFFLACSWLTWLNLLYMLAYVKLAVSLVKYIPQVRRHGGDRVHSTAQQLGRPPRPCMAFSLAGRRPCSWCCCWSRCS
jgi:hypothetical protein